MFKGLTEQHKMQLYESGHYLFSVPPVCTNKWTDKDWITFIGDNWTACKDPNCECHKILDQHVDTLNKKA